MESQIATHHDAEIILKLYDLRREEVLRKARHWVVFEFNPKTAEEFLGTLQGGGTQENAYFRQVISYWEMAASLVVHGAVKSDLYLDSNGEGILVFAKFYAFRETYTSKTGFPFMRQTAQLIEKYPMARDRFNARLKMIQDRAK
ncbi:MAG TPA: hypothetical protein VMF56_11590 [Acidobacteriaceae bacterium]|nr:hypothetical protein [Acidobacteriaceae bacterium]